MPAASPQSTSIPKSGHTRQCPGCTDEQRCFSNRANHVDHAEPIATRAERDWRLGSSHARTTVPSRIRRTTSSSASERWHHASQSACHFRHVRLTVSFDTAPLNSVPAPASPGAGWCRTGRRPRSAPPPASSSAHSVATLHCAIPGSPRRRCSVVRAARCFFRTE